MTTRYTVRTRDVDCSTTRKFATLPGARKRFEEMVGYTMEAAIAEQYHQCAEAGQPFPAVEEVKHLRAVSNFGTVVTFEAQAA